VSLVPALAETARSRARFKPRSGRYRFVTYGSAGSGSRHCRTQLPAPSTTGQQSSVSPGIESPDLADPLPFPDDAFDDVVASLVLHCLEDWGPSLAELRRVLRPGGRLIASVDHPFAINLMHRQAGPRPDYSATHNRTEEWTMGGRPVPMSFWNRPLHAMTDAFTAAGFRIAAIHEPHPVPEAREVFPDDFGILDTFPSFLFFVLEAG
jgi:SAM-dependent methyltransferase